MSNYTPPDAHNLILDFNEPVSSSTDLNFGDSASSNAVNGLINLSVISRIHGKQSSSAKEQVLASIKTGINPRISGKQTISYLRKIRAVINTGVLGQFSDRFDLNFIVGVSGQFGAKFQKALFKAIQMDTPWAKPILRAHNSAFYFERSLGLSNHASVEFDNANTLQRTIQVIHEQTTGLSRSAYLKWRENERLVISKTLVFEESEKLRISRNTDWVELVRKRKTFTYSHQVAHVFEKHFSFEWDKGLELITTSEIAWDKAKAIHYRKHPVLPWPKPEPPQYEGNNDLNFNCLCDEQDVQNLILNFGDDDCIPGLPNQNWWYIVNELSVSRLDNGQNILVYDGNYSADRNGWCWSYSLIVPASEIPKLKPINGQPVILKILVNGNEHHMLLENRSRSRRFAEITYVLKGRSQSALLDAPYAPARSFTQENERTARQLCQAELDRVNSSTQMKWELIDELSWILPSGSLSYSSMPPIAVIKMIAESAGGFVCSEKGNNTITIKPKYKKTFWDSIAIEEYDRLIPESLVTDQSTDCQPYPDYNGITLTNDRGQLSGQVRRTGTSANTLLETVNNPLFTVESMGAYGKAALAKAGMIETHSLVMPVNANTGECAPSDIVAFNAEWWGTVESVNVSFNHAVINQSIKVESVNRE
ncbi:hypothetical protein E0H83_01155 [Acinetobacter terrestris]|uniref:hypothetical protein n=1 Tax=Acinetobacter terrestris TaxID=2529843 RepID=UPI00103E4891|nr:hypothetical protein [Acinetobacter terrestris]TCB48378.1 hypothetical protein E0H83_01155 [Acinetobacter terrestris]